MSTKEKVVNHIVILKPVLVSGKLVSVGTILTPSDFRYEDACAQYPVANRFACHDVDQLKEKHAVLFYDPNDFEDADAQFTKLARSKVKIDTSNLPRGVKVSKAYVKDTEVKDEVIKRDEKTVLSVNGVDQVEVEKKVLSPEEAAELKAAHDKEPKELTQKDFRRKKSKEAPSTQGEL